MCSRTGRVEETARLTSVPASSRSLASSPMDPQPYNGRLVSRTGRIPPRLRLLPIPDRDQHFQIARFPPLDAPPSGRTPRPRPASARSVATRRQDPASAVAGTGFRASMNPIRPSRPPPGGTRASRSHSIWFSARISQPSWPRQTRQASVAQRSSGHVATEGSASIRDRKPTGRFRTYQPSSRKIL